MDELLARGEFLVCAQDPSHAKVLAVQQYMAHLRYAAAADDEEIGPKDSVAAYTARGEALANAPRPIRGRDAVALALYLTLHLDAVLRVPVLLRGLRRSDSTTRRKAAAAAEAEPRPFHMRGLLLQSSNGDWGLVGRGPDHHTVNMVKPAMYPSLLDVITEWALEVEGVPGTASEVTHVTMGLPVDHVASATAAVSWSKAKVDVAGLGWSLAAVALNKYEAKLRLVALNVRVETRVAHRMDERARATVLNTWANPDTKSQLSFAFVSRGTPPFCVHVGTGPGSAHRQAIDRHARVHSRVPPTSSVSTHTNADVRAAYEWASANLADLDTLYTRPDAVDDAVVQVVKDRPDAKTLIKRLTSHATLNNNKGSRVSGAAPPSSSRSGDATSMAAVVAHTLVEFGNAVPGQANVFDITQAREFDANSLRYEPHELVSKVRLTDHV